MKKFLVLTLTVVFILSLSAIAAASTFDPYVGGEFQIVYAPDDEGGPGTTDETPWSVGGDGTYARYKSYVTGRVEDKDTNTWAKIGAKFTVWNSNSDAKFDAVYEGGIKQIGGVLDIWYTNDENGNTKRGQIPLNQPPYKFGGDPGFSDGIGNCFGFDYNKNAVAVNLIYCPNKENAKDADGVIIPNQYLDNKYAIAGTYKLNDSSNVWAGYRSDPDKTKKYGVGAQLGTGFGAVACDLIAKSPDVGDTGSYIQGNVNLKALKLDITALLDNKYFFANDGGMGVGVVYNITDKLYVGGKTVFANEKVDEGKNVDDYYVGYKYGVFDSRIGFGTRGTGDSFVYATAHAGLW